MERRRFLATAAGGLGVGLAGCLGGGNPNVTLPSPDREVDSETLPYPAWGEQVPDVSVNAPLADREVALRGVDEPTLLTFFYSYCMTVCPQLVSTLRNVQTHAIEQGYVDSVRFLPISFDPQRDTAARLRTYADQMNVADDSWTWLRPDGLERAETIVTDEFGVAYERTRTDSERYMFAHTGMTTLVNADGYVERAYQQGPNDITTADRLIEDLERVR